MRFFFYMLSVFYFGIFESFSVPFVPGDEAYELSWGDYKLTYSQAATSDDPQNYWLVHKDGVLKAKAKKSFLYFNRRLLTDKRLAMMLHEAVMYDEQGEKAYAFGLSRDDMSQFFIFDQDDFEELNSYKTSVMFGDKVVLTRLGFLQSSSIKAVNIGFSLAEFCISEYVENESIVWRNIKTEKYETLGTLTAPYPGKPGVWDYEFHSNVSKVVPVEILLLAIHVLYHFLNPDILTVQHGFGPQPAAFSVFDFKRPRPEYHQYKKSIKNNQTQSTNFSGLLNSFVVSAPSKKDNMVGRSTSMKSPVKAANDVAASAPLAASSDALTKSEDQRRAERSEYIRRMEQEQLRAVVPVESNTDWSAFAFDEDELARELVIALLNAIAYQRAEKMGTWGNQSRGGHKRIKSILLGRFSDKDLFYIINNIYLSSACIARYNCDALYVDYKKSIGLDTLLSERSLAQWKQEIKKVFNQDISEETLERAIGDIAEAYKAIKEDKYFLEYSKDLGMNFRWNYWIFFERHNLDPYHEPKPLDKDQELRRHLDSEASISFFFTSGLTAFHVLDPRIKKVINTKTFPLKDILEKTHHVARYRQYFNVNQFMHLLKDACELYPGNREIAMATSLGRVSVSRSARRKYFSETDIWHFEYYSQRVKELLEIYKDTPTSDFHKYADTLHPLANIREYLHTQLRLYRASLPVDYFFFNQTIFSFIGDAWKGVTGLLTQGASSKEHLQITDSKTPKRLTTTRLLIGTTPYVEPMDEDESGPSNVDRMEPEPPVIAPRAPVLLNASSSAPAFSHLGPSNTYIEVLEER